MLRPVRLVFCVHGATTGRQDGQPKQLARAEVVCTQGCLARRQEGARATRLKLTVILAGRLHTYGGGGQRASLGLHAMGPFATFEHATRIAWPGPVHAVVVAGGHGACCS